MQRSILYTTVLGNHLGRTSTEMLMLHSRRWHYSKNYECKIRLSLYIVEELINFHCLSHKLSKYNVNIPYLLIVAETFVFIDSNYKAKQVSLHKLTLIANKCCKAYSLVIKTEAILGQPILFKLHYRWLLKCIANH